MKYYVYLLRCILDVHNSMKDYGSISKDIAAGLKKCQLFRIVTYIFNSWHGLYDIVT